MKSGIAENWLFRQSSATAWAAERWSPVRTVELTACHAQGLVIWTTTLRVESVYHLCQDHPEVIGEVSRILSEHAAAHDTRGR
jgi:hypothetical protein